MLLSWHILKCAAVLSSRPDSERQPSRSHPRYELRPPKGRPDLIGRLPSCVFGGELNYTLIGPLSRNSRFGKADCCLCLLPAVREQGNWDDLWC